MLKTLSAVAAIAMASVLVLPTVSHAEAANSARVSYADLNLTGADGQQALQRRIANVAGGLCNYGQFQDVSRMSNSSACKRETVANAQPAYDAAIQLARRGTVTVLDAAALIVTAQ